METFTFILETVGIIAFAVAGSVAAIDKEADLFGVLFLALITSFGGGMLRDVLIGNTPAFFTSYLSITIAAITTLTVFILASVFKEKYVKNTGLVDKINNYFDAVGLGIFAVTGAKICINSGYDSALVAISLGMITSVGGGMIRDLCLREIPFVLTKRVYAVASICGAGIYYVLVSYTKVPEYLSLIVGVVLVFAIRMLATIYKLDIPKAIIFKKMETANKEKEPCTQKN